MYILIGYLWAFVVGAINKFDNPRHYGISILGWPLWVLVNVGHLLFWLVQVLVILLGLPLYALRAPRKEPKF